jgi:hypothetical protein
VCLIDDKPAVLICDLPLAENEHFKLVKYGLYALKHTYNRGIVFNDFPVPAENLLQVTKGNGLTIAYHGLNLGRVALCANAAGSMRLMMASMIPWARFRVTYGEAIAKRELVRRRLGRLAGLVVACDALVAWCSTLLDQGYRGEMECIVAKIFGSEAQKEAAIELFMKTHGGRSFLHGHMFGDHVHEYLAPCIYEGEGEMLGMALFKSLVKQHGTQFFEPVGKLLAANQMKTFSPANPLDVWKLRSALVPYGSWWAREMVSRKWRTELGPLDRRIAAACDLCHPRPTIAAAGDQRDDAQAPAQAGRPPMPDERAFQPGAEAGGHAGDKHLCRPAERRDRALGGGRDVPGSDARAHRPAPQRPLFPLGQHPGRSDRRRQVRLDLGAGAG